MLRETGAQFGAGCGGTSVVTALAAVPELPPRTLSERLSREFGPIGLTLAQRKVSLHSASETLGQPVVTVPLQVGMEACRLQLSASLVDWLQKPLGLAAPLTEEQPLQRSLLLELVMLDVIRLLERHLGKDVRLGDRDGEDLPLSINLSINEREQAHPLRLEVGGATAEAFADFLDSVQPVAPPDLSGTGAAMILQAGTQELTTEEIASLRPGDVVMFETGAAHAVLNGRLAASVRRLADRLELAGPFSPLGERARSVSAPSADIGQENEVEHFRTVTFEFGRLSMTLGEIDRLKPGSRLPFAYSGDDGVDFVVDDRRVGRGELVTIGTGHGVRIVHLFPGEGIEDSHRE